jgi:hypothetical protein
MRRLSVGVAWGCIVLMAAGCSTHVPHDTTPAQRFPQLFPDYVNVTIPPNIAPCNFIIKENGTNFCAEIRAQSGKPHLVYSGKGTLAFRAGLWKKLLAENAGKELYITVYSRNKKEKWVRYDPFTISIASDPVDRYLAYRLIDPGFEQWSEMGIYQRDLASFTETPIFTNRATGTGTCMNCHSFCKKDPDRMLFHLRAGYGGTILFHDNLLDKIDTKTPYTMSAGVYPSWHPDGNLIAFSINKINQFFSLIPDQTINVVDFHSDIIVYNVEKNMVFTSPLLSTKKKENLPEWSPDGKYLYYCVADTGEDIWKSVYELMRIRYDAEKNLWGKVDTVLSYARFGASISFPKISPDGRYLLFTAAPFGYFTINYKESDLFLLDLQTMSYRPLAINSDNTESYHCWSSNGRWIVFSSKRGDGLSARPYFSYFNAAGKEHKPFLLPQKDPTFYSLMYKSYNVPEFITGKVNVPYHRLKKKAYSTAIPSTFDPAVDIDGLSGASRIKKQIN